MQACAWTGHWRSNTPESKTARCAEADGGLEPMQLLQVRQVLGEQASQARGVPEMFGQRTTSGFPQSMDPMHVPGSSGEYLGDVFAKSEKWLGTPPTPDCAKWTSREAEILGWQAYIYDLTAWRCKPASSSAVRSSMRAGGQTRLIGTS